MITDGEQTDDGSNPVRQVTRELLLMRSQVAEILEIADKNSQPEIAYHAMALDFAISDALTPSGSEL